MADEIEKLNNLKEKGALSEEEYARAKEALLRKNQSTITEAVTQTVNELSADVNAWSMFIHLSQFCGYIIPFAGLVVPIILWQMKKNESEIIDAHGKVVANWIITEIILGAVFVVLWFILIGVPLLFALIVAGLVFPIIGGLKAKKGELWPYPFSIKIFK